jgi:hypothetical protein
MQVMPIEAMIYMGNRLPHHEDETNTQENKGIVRRGLEDINPSFKYYMSTSTPNPNAQPTFTGHWPTYYKNPSPVFDPNGMLFPMTCVPTPNPVPGHLNILA